MKRWIKASSNTSYVRGILADYLDNGTLTKEQYEAALDVNLDISGDDLAVLVEGGYLDDADKLKSIRYISDKTLSKIKADKKGDIPQYDGGYIFRYRSGAVEWYGFFAGDDDIYFILSNE